MFLFSVLLAIAVPDVILPPPGSCPSSSARSSSSSASTSSSSASSVAIVLVQGAQITASAYEPLLNATQKRLLAADDCLEAWVAAPQYPASVTEPAVIGGGITRVVAELHARGMPNSTAVFLAGHSLGGAMLELWVHDNPAGFAGAVFMGSFVSRSRRSPEGLVSFPLPTLTVAAELDGLSRITRNGAEAFHAQISLAPSRQQAAKQNPVVVVEGMSHMQFASGSPPLLVKERDLMPEISYDEAHDAVSEALAAFVRMIHSGDASSTALISSLVDKAGLFVEPIIKAMELEGSEHLVASCDSDFPTNPTCGYNPWPGHSVPVPGCSPKKPSPPPPSQCICGSSWVMDQAQLLMAGWDEAPVRGIQSKTKDAFHDVSAVCPFHLPHIFNTCSSGQGCVLETETVSMLIYEKLDGLDTGFSSISALEMRTKLKSREALWEAAGIANVDVKVTDQNTTRCQRINQAALDWALGNASPETTARYHKLGEAMVIGPDVNSPIGITGPTWIGKTLEYTHVKGGDGRSEYQVVSPYFIVNNKQNGNVSWYDPVGMHYCKLLSPARAMEWIYVDSNRMYNSLNNHSTDE